MQKSDLSLTERLSERFLSWLWTNRVPFFSSLIFGLLAHAFVLTNKIPNHDDVAYLFSKGETVGSGRWGLELLRIVIPDYSMPWLHGIVSLLLLSFSICLIIRIFHIQRKLGQILLSALIICFPSQIGTFCYMYTSSCYAVAFLLSILAVREAAENSWKHWLLSVLLIVLVFSIYQAYAAIISALMILLLIRKLLSAGTENCALSVLKRGLLYVGILFAALELYRLSITLSLSFIGGEVNQYSNEAQYMAPSFPGSILVAYRFFVFNLTSRYNMLIVSKVSRVLHLFGLALALFGLTANQLRARNLPNLLLLLFCLIVLPLGICWLYMAFYWNTIHTLVLYAYFTLYVLMVFAVEELPPVSLKVSRDVLYAALAVILGINVCFANRCYLKLHLEYENAYSLATTLVTQIRSLPNYDITDRVILYPAGGNALHFDPAFGTEDLQKHDLMGVQIQLLTGYTEADFIHRYIGAEMKILSREEAEELLPNYDYDQIPVYPAAGSVTRVDDDLIIVRFASSPY